MSTSIVILALIIIVCFLLVVVIMVQNPKGSGLSGTFGGGGGAQMGGVKKTDDFLNKSTWTLATALLVLILLFNVTGRKGSAVQNSRLLDGQTPSAIPAPTTTEEGQSEAEDTFNSSDFSDQNTEKTTD